MGGPGIYFPLNVFSPLISSFKEQFRESVEIQFGPTTIRIAQVPPSISDNLDGPEPLGTGTVLWDSAEVLAREIHAKKIPLTDCIVVELGAGCGLAGITAATFANPISVILTDLHFMQSHLRNNVALNPTVCPVSVTELDWTMALPTFLLELLSDKTRIVVIGSDLIYREEDSECLADTVSSLFEKLPVVSAHFVLEYHNQLAVSLFANKLRLIPNLRVESNEIVGSSKLRLTVFPAEKKRDRQESESELENFPAKKFQRRATLLPGSVAYEDAVTASLFAVDLLSSGESGSDSDSSGS